MRRTSSALLTALALLLAGCGTAETTDTVAVGAATDEQESAALDQRAADRDGEQLDEQRDDEPGDARDQDEASTGANGSDDDRIGQAAEAGTLRSALLETALDPASELSSARFEGRIEMVGGPDSELPGPVSLTFAGAYDLANDAAEVSMDFSSLIEAAARAEGGDAAELGLFAGMFDEPLQVITIGDTSWIKWGLVSMFTGTEGLWLEGEAEDSGELTAGFGFGGSGSPTALLDLLADADAQVERVGTEDVRGTSTTHYRAVVDAETLAETMTPGERAQYDAELGVSAMAEFPLELWIDDDGLVHRYRLDFSDPGMLEESGGELQSAELVFEIWDHGADLGITPPPADLIITEDEIDMGFGAFSDLEG